MRELPFRVSARAARLIGAENIANAESAVIELIKNSYDADAEHCIVYFEHLFTVLPNSYTAKHVEYLSQSEQFEDFKSFFVKADNECFVLRESLEDNEREKVSDWILNVCRIWIIDDGIGMNEQVIEDNWMTIGTNNKEKAPISKKFKRIKSGAKGLGRFALDKLGNISKVYIFPDPEYHRLEQSEKALEWVNIWESFLQDGKTLDMVTAKMDYKQMGREFHSSFIPSYLESINIDPIILKNSGVIICCEANKENWHFNRQKKLRDSLETLVPAIDNDNFSILFFSNKYEELNGIVSSALNSNYDYKVTAEFQGESVRVEIHRNEFDVQKIPDKFYQMDEFKALSCSKDDFKKEIRVFDLKITNLFPKYPNLDKLKSLGSFYFKFYFSKQGQPKPDEFDKFLYKAFDLRTRKSWTDTFGGVRIFRDNFRVRPYGEQGSAKDWLGLGDRAASSPAGVGKVEGGWRVRPNQISGAVNISRINNPLLSDKSSREGLQENDEFTLFKSTLTKVIDLFEEDRAKVGLALRKLHDERNEQSKQEQMADELVETILDDKQKNNSSTNDRTDSSSQADNTNIELLASQYQRKKEELEELKEEQKMLRSLATIGTISSSFSHELKHLYGKLVKRFSPIENVLLQCSKANDDSSNMIASDISDSLELLKIYKKQDSSLKDWIDFSLLGIKKDKRKRRKVSFDSYFRFLSKSWERKFDDRKIDIETNLDNPDTALRCFEIDLDCIFNNLIINSVEAFSQKDAPQERRINISIFSSSDKFITITYRDSGPGLASEILDPDKIFNCFFTTKVNEHSGEEEGTGIGMWMVKSTVNEYRGTIKLLLGISGFGIEIKIPKNV